MRMGFAGSDISCLWQIEREKTLCLPGALQRKKGGDYRNIDDNLGGLTGGRSKHRGDPEERALQQASGFFRRESQGFKFQLDGVQ